MKIRIGQYIYKLERNSQCPCGSGIKFKNCHLKIMEGFEKTSDGNWVKHTHGAYKNEYCQTCKILGDISPKEVKGGS